MTTYAVSFNINYNNPTSYNTRYDSLMAEIRKCKRVWSETTSFCLCETNESLENFERRLYLSKFDPVQDKMLVFDAHMDDGIARGKIEYPSTLKALMCGFRRWRPPIPI